MKEGELYYLCSSEVIRHFPNAVKSKPFKSGYSVDSNDVYYIIILSEIELKNYYKDVIEPYNAKSHVEDIDFWCEPCIPGTHDISKVTLTGCKQNGLFYEIGNKTGFTTDYNQAMIIYNLSQKFNCTPIKLISKIK